MVNRIRCICLRNGIDSEVKEVTTITLEILHLKNSLRLIRKWLRSTVDALYMLNLLIFL